MNQTTKTIFDKTCDFIGGTLLLAFISGAGLLGNVLIWKALFKALNI